MTENEARAESALRAVQHFKHGPRGDDGARDNDPVNMRDLLTNLMHLSDEMGWDFHNEYRIARDNYNEEPTP